ncbi:MAG: ABC transporter substrate-binding protein [Acidobacteriota bacterium]
MRRLTGAFCALVAVVSVFAAAVHADARPRVDAAIGFTIAPLEDGAHRLTVHMPDGRNNAPGPVLHTYVLVPRAQLDADRLPADAPPSGPDVTVLAVPLARVITTSTTEVGALDALGAIDRLVGVDDPRYLTSAAARARVEAGLVQAVGGASGLDPERVVAAAPDAVFAAGFGPRLDPRGTFDRLRGAGVPVVAMPSFLETHPLGRAEWIKVVGLLVGDYAKADAFYRAVAERYRALATMGRAAGGATTAPRVLTGLPQGDTWFVPGGRSFFAQLLRDAGLRYLWADDDRVGSLPLDLETVLQRAADADVWIQPGLARSLADLTARDPRYAALPPVAKRQVYNNDLRLGPGGSSNDYWERGTLRPDEVLADLLRLMHPGLLNGHQPVYHRRLPAE